jgi:hypothetical protein
MTTDGMWIIGNNSPPSSVIRNVAIVKDNDGQVFHDDVDYFYSEDCYSYKGTITEGDTAYHCFVYTEGV